MWNRQNFNLIFLRRSNVFFWIDASCLPTCALSSVNACVWVRKNAAALWSKCRGISIETPRHFFRVKRTTRATINVKSCDDMRRLGREIKGSKFKVQSVRVLVKCLCEDKSRAEYAEFMLKSRMGVWNLALKKSDFRNGFSYARTPYCVGKLPVFR